MMLSISLPFCSLALPLSLSLSVSLLRASRKRLCRIADNSKHMQQPEVKSCKGSKRAVMSAISGEVPLWYLHRPLSRDMVTLSRPKNVQCMPTAILELIESLTEP